MMPRRRERAGLAAGWAAEVVMAARAVTAVAAAEGAMGVLVVREAAVGQNRAVQPARAETAVSAPGAPMGPAERSASSGMMGLGGRRESLAMGIIPNQGLARAALKEITAMV